MKISYPLATLVEIILDRTAAGALFTISTEARAAIHSILGFDVSADGQKFVILVVSSAEGPTIVVVQNWEKLLSLKPM